MLWNFLNEVVLADLDKYICHLLPFTSDLTEYLPNVTMCVDVVDDDSIRVGITCYNKDASDFVEKEFTGPFRSPSHLVRNIINFVNPKKKHRNGRTSIPWTERQLIRKYSKGLDLALSRKWSKGPRLVPK